LPNKSAIRLIVSDLDATLLGSGRVLSPFTVATLERCRAAGIRTAYATARSEQSCTRITAQFAPDAMITNGGALARCQNLTLHCAALPADTANAFARACAGNPHIRYLTAETDAGYFVDRPVDLTHTDWRDYGHTIQRDFLREPFACAVYKFSVEIDDQATALALAAPFENMDVLRFSGEDWYRYAHTAATKWQGLQALARHWNIAPEHIAAFGDDYNDVEMLTHCGYGIAVENAIPACHALARDRCGPNTGDGVAHWLVQNVLAWRPE